MKSFMNSKEKSSLKRNRSQSKDIIGRRWPIFKMPPISIFSLYSQFNNQNSNKDDNSKIEHKLGLLETQMNAKILQMQSKKAKLFKLKKSQDSSGGEQKVFTWCRLIGLFFSLS